jgi:hypothetical protein
VIRGACRKVRENDVPAISGEEVRQQQNKSKDEGFVPPKHTWTEAIGWTTGIVLTYEFIHRRRGITSFLEDAYPISTASPGLYDTRVCPFRLTTRAIAQPIVSTVNSVFSITTTHRERPVQSRKSIDVTPFIQDGDALFYKVDESELLPSPRNYSSSLEDDDGDDGIQFDEKFSQVQQTKQTRPKDSTVASVAERISGDIFSALGAFKFLVGEGQGKSGGIDLMEKGAELGSGRSFYNLGVSYDRLNETQLANEYYKRAADLGHPLASYNLGVMTLKDGKVSEGLALLQYAAENGVEEAKGAMQGLVAATTR